ncbi:MAG: hypothetical protein HFF01_03555 [Erysipelotrichaceae bacterium]|nr:hypothetical protein [Erysipelotrichaceae bacterium]
MKTAWKRILFLALCGMLSLSAAQINTRAMETETQGSQPAQRENQVLSNHSTLNYSQQDIANAYKNSLKTFDYLQSIYSSAPSAQSPYKAGALKDGVKKDTLNQLNYLRWLAGLNSVTIQDQYMERSQKGAVLLKATDTLTHYPTKPSDMSDEFFKEGEAAVGAGYGYSGNVAYGYRTMADAIQGYADDDYNVNAGVGHRLSMLDPNAYGVSFGFMAPYNAVSIYTSSKGSYSDAFYAWPSAGYFPIENLSVDAPWSIQLMSPYQFGKYSVVLTYKGNNYNALNYVYHDYYNALSFALPDTLKNALIDGDSYKSGELVTVSVYNVSNGSDQSLIIQYPVNFMSAKNPVTVNTNPPEMTTNIKAQSVGTTSVKLTWNRSTDADGYLIYRQNSDQKYGYRGMVRGRDTTSYTDTTAKTDDFNYYWVFPYKEVNGKKIVGGFEKYTYSKPVPASAKNVRAVANGASVRLTWSKVDNVDGYIIYRQLPNETKMSYLYRVTGTGFIDTTAQLNDFNFYRIYPYKNVNGKNVIGLSEKHVYAKPTLTNVTNLKAVGQTYRRIQLSWNAHAGVDGYIVYRQDPNTNTFTYRLMTTSTGFIDTVSKANEYYYYRVYPYKMVNGKMITGTSVNYVYAKSK